jgi:hypothetical protein
MKKLIVLFFVVVFCFTFVNTTIAARIVIEVPVGGNVLSSDDLIFPNPEQNWTVRDVTVYQGNTSEIKSINSETIGDTLYNVTAHSTVNAPLNDLGEYQVNSGTWSSIYAIDYIAVKAGNYFVIYDADGLKEGNWSTIDLLVGQGGQQPNLSHIEFFSSTKPVPIPAAAWLLGTGLAGLVGIRRKMKK